MPRIVYVGPFDQVDVPLIYGAVRPGEPFDVTDAQAALLLDQPDNFQPAPKVSKESAR